MSYRGDLATHDHLDLLVSACVRYGLLVSSTTAAFSPAAADASTVASPAAAGRLLLEENLAALRWRQGRGRGALHLPDDQLHYDHRPVDRLEPVEVVKAGHAYQHLAADSPGWSGSAARRLVDAVVHAATQRLPGYAEAPWHWTRPPARPGPPAGLRGEWTPVDRGVVWVTPDELAQRWDEAALIVLTVDALDELPAGLPARPGVYLCAPGTIDDEHWPAVTQLQPDVVVLVPAGRAWLLEQLDDPATPVQRPRVVQGLR